MFKPPNKPNAKSLRLIAAIVKLLDNTPFRLGASTVRYRLANGGIMSNAKDGDESESQKNAIERLLKTARALDMIGWDQIVDQGQISTTWFGYASPSDWVKDSIRTLVLLPWPAQPVYLHCFVEAAGLKDQFDHALSRYRVDVEYGGGNGSWTQLHSLAEKMARQATAFDKPAVILTFGDWNPSGKNIHDEVVEAMRKWCPIPVDVRRAALVRKDLKRYKLPTYKPKAGDLKAGNWVGPCAELESMGDDAIIKRIHEEIAKILDLEALAKIERKSKRLQAKARKALKEFA